MKITLDEIMKMKDWKKAIFHPLVRPITEKMDTVIKQRYGSDVQWLFDNYTSLVFDKHFRIEEEDSCFEIEDVHENVDGKYNFIQIIIYRDQVMSKIWFDLVDILEE